MRANGIFLQKADELKRSALPMMIMLKMSEKRGSLSISDEFLFKAWLNLFNKKVVALIRESRSEIDPDKMLRDAQILVPILLEYCDPKIHNIIHRSFSLYRSGILKLDLKSDQPWIRNLQTLHDVSHQVLQTNLALPDILAGFMRMRNRCYLLYSCY